MIENECFIYISSRGLILFILYGIIMENLHPIVVHFPIALLTLYSILEILSLSRKIRASKTVWYIKLFLVVVGLISVQAALTTGEIAGDA